MGATRIALDRAQLQAGFCATKNAGRAAKVLRQRATLADTRCQHGRGGLPVLTADAVRLLPFSGRVAILQLRGRSIVALHQDLAVSPRPGLLGMLPGKQAPASNEENPR